MDNNKNKFLKEIDHAPPSSRTRLVLKWDIDHESFSTADFHPRRVRYRISINDITRVRVGVTRS